MANCNKCGKPIEWATYFKDGEKKYRPVEPGTDERHVCGSSEPKQSKPPTTAANNDDDQVITLLVQIRDLLTKLVEMKT